MTILQEILIWSQGLPAWQSDALGRLLTKQPSGDDLDDIFALLKAAHGIPDPKVRTPKKLTSDQIPVAVQDSAQVVLSAIKNLKNVNAIAENQRLVVGLTGLTVIYGDNGSGKSGYSRVLKRACRARDHSETIHPNANLPSCKHCYMYSSANLIIVGLGPWAQKTIIPYLDKLKFEEKMPIKIKGVIDLVDNNAAKQVAQGMSAAYIGVSRRPFLEEYVITFRTSFIEIMVTTSFNRNSETV